MPEIPDVNNNCDSEGIAAPVAGIIGILQANEVLKTILKIKDDLTNKMLVFDALKTNFRKIKLTKDRSCINKC